MYQNKSDTANKKKEGENRPMEETAEWLFFQSKKCPPHGRYNLPRPPDRQIGTRAKLEIKRRKLIEKIK